MPAAASNLAGVRSLGACRSIIEAWRRLTGGPSVPDADRCTLVACSGGGDSSAMAIALASSGGAVVLGHVVHDLRSASESESDAQQANELADLLGIPFERAIVHVRDLPGNAEANAREARYEALEAMAREHGCPFVATAHHAGDQAETMLMAAARGAGPSGLAGIDSARPLSPVVTLIRPMLRVAPQEARALCDAAGWQPAIDATNSDVSRTRARVRHEVLGGIIEAMPTLLERLSDTSEVLAEADRVVGAQAVAIWSRAEVGTNQIRWPIAAFEEQSWLVVSAHLRDAHAELTGGRGADSLSLRVVRPVAEAIIERACARSVAISPREYRWRRVVLIVDQACVTMRLIEPEERSPE